MNYQRRLSFCLPVILLAFGGLAALAEPGSVSLTIVATYDYPDAVYIYPSGINKQGDVADITRLEVGIRRGSLSRWQSSAPIVA
jgi:hypothetical protein